MPDFSEEDRETIASEEAKILTPSQQLSWKTAQDMQQQLIEFCREHEICAALTVSLKGAADSDRVSWVTKHACTNSSQVPTENVTATTILQDYADGLITAEMGGILALMHSPTDIGGHLGLSVMEQWLKHQKPSETDNPPKSLSQGLFRRAFGSQPTGRKLANAYPSPALIVLMRYTIHEVADQLSGEELRQYRFTLQDVRNTLDHLTPWSWLELFVEEYRDKAPDLDAIRQELEKLVELSPDKWDTVYAIHVGNVGDDDEDEKENDE